MKTWKVSITLFLSLFILGPINLATASEEWPTTALEYYRAMEKIKGKMYVKSRTKTVDAGLKESVKAFWAESSDCFNMVVETYKVGTFKDKKKGSRKYTPTMKWINKRSAIFGLQMLAFNAKGDVDRKVHRGKGSDKGVFIMATRFDSVGKGKTRLTSYFAWGPVGKNLSKAGEKWAAGKKAACPTKYL